MCIFVLLALFVDFNDDYVKSNKHTKLYNIINYNTQHWIPEVSKLTEYQCIPVVVVLNKSDRIVDYSSASAYVRAFQNDPAIKHGMLFFLFFLFFSFGNLYQIHFVFYFVFSLVTW